MRNELLLKVIATCVKMGFYLAIALVFIPEVFGVQTPLSLNDQLGLHLSSSRPRCFCPFPTYSTPPRPSSPPVPLGRWLW